MKIFVGSLLSVVLLVPLLGGCQRGHYTDGHYIGDPERVGAASEAEQERQKRPE